MNENYAHPAMPAGAEEGILKGMYRIRGDGSGDVQLLGSGTILRECLKAADILKQEHGITADVWSVTSWSELRRDGAAAEEATIFGGKATESYVAKCLGGTKGAVVAASDYVKAVPELVRAYVPQGRRYVALGTDGFGRSDTGAALREYFRVDARGIAKAVVGVR